MGKGDERFIKSLLRFSGDDFEVWESSAHDMTYYNISIEGYMGFENLQQCVDLYNSFLTYLLEYLTSNCPKPEDFSWNRLYRTRAVEICHEYHCYWVFLDSYKSSQAWDIYTYMVDVINQLNEYIKNDNT